MKKLFPILLLTCVLLGSYRSIGQDKSDNNRTNKSSVFVEIGGNAPQISLNYDYLIQTKKESIKCAFTIGATHHFNSTFDFIIAPQFNVLIGRKIMAEIGVGVTIPIAHVDDGVMVLRFGGRYQKMGGGMFYRLAFTPIISPHSDTFLLPMFGISIGYTFKCNKISKSGS